MPTAKAARRSGITSGSSCEAETVYNDTWWLINASGTNGTPQWIQITPSNPPTARAGQTAVYNAPKDEMIVYGGNEGNGTPLLDIAVLSNATHTGSAWSDDVLSGPALSLHSAVYDSVHDRMMVFGGYSTGGEWNSGNRILFNASGGIRSWIEVFPGGSTFPPPTLAHTAVYDPPSQPDDRFWRRGGNRQQYILVRWRPIFARSS